MKSGQEIKVIRKNSLHTGIFKKIICAIIATNLKLELNKVNTSYIYEEK